MNTDKAHGVRSLLPARTGLWLSGLVCGLLPLCLNWSRLSRLFWFVDDWDLMDQISRQGWWSWTWQVFAENFVPLFKLLWSGTLWLGGGDFRVALLALWLTHALNTALLGRWLQAGGIGLAGCLLAQVVFGLSVINVETLGWSVQWSAVLSFTFLFAALLTQQQDQQRPAAAWRTGLWSLLCLASAWCFARGVLTGGLVALACLWPAAAAVAPRWSRRALQAGICLLPAAATALLIMLYAHGNHQQLSGHGTDMPRYALWYWGMNPLHRLLEMDTEGPRTLALLLAGKLLLLGYAWRQAREGQRRLLVLALLFDLGNALLLGIGRYHTGLPAALSSRYQYGSLVGFLPFAAVALDSLGARLAFRPWLRPLVATLLLTWLAWHCLGRWDRELRPFVASRGEASRAVLTGTPDAACAVPGIPFLPCSRARELGREFHLH